MKNVFIFLFVIGFAMTGCTPVKSLADTSCVGYRSSDFSREDIANKGIAIMPVLGGENKEQFRRPMGDALHRNMALIWGSDKVKSPAEVIEALNNNDLATAYTTAVSNYIATGIVPKDLVSKLGEATSCNYLLYSRLLAESEYGYDPTLKILSRVDEVYVQCQVWDIKKGDIVWEGKGGVSKLDNNNTDIIDATASGLAKVVGLNNNEGPCEDRAALLKALQQSMTGTFLIGGVAILTVLLVIGLGAGI